MRRGVAELRCERFDPAGEDMFVVVVVGCVLCLQKGAEDEGDLEGLKGTRSFPSPCHFRVGGCAMPESLN